MSSDLERWMAYMRRGDFDAAWDLSDELLARREPSWHLPRHEQSIWDGTPLDGKRVLIRCYHGLGDTVQFKFDVRRHQCRRSSRQT